MEQAQVNHAIQVVNHLNQLDISPIHVTVGGVFASAAHSTLLSDCSDFFDSIVVGEGEETVLELIDNLREKKEWRGIPGIAYLSNGKVVLSQRRMINKIDHLPWASRDTLDRVLEMDGIPVFSSERGCSSNCTFCMDREKLSHFPSSQRWRGRSVKDMADEIEWLVNEKGVTRLRFIGENTIGGLEHKARLMRFGDELIKRNINVRFNIYMRASDVEVDVLQHLQKAGLSWLFIGFESFWQPSLDRFCKSSTVSQNIEALHSIRQVKGLCLRFGIIMYHPWVNLEEIIHNLKVIRQEILGFDSLGPQKFIRLHNPLIIYKGTPIYRAAKYEGLLISDPKHNGQVCDYILPSAVRKHFDTINNEFIELYTLQRKYEHRLEKYSYQCDIDSKVEKLVRWTQRVAILIVDTSENLASAICANWSDSRIEELFYSVRKKRENLRAEVSSFSFEN